MVDTILISPPFSVLDRPSLALHLLQACARSAGFDVRVLYANMQFAAKIGVKLYDTIGFAAATSLVGERIFAAAAYDLEPLGQHPADMFEPDLLVGGSRSIAFERHSGFPISLEELYSIEAMAAPFADAIARRVLEARPRIVGCTTCYDETAASVAILKRIKALSPEIITIIGGSNCEGEMAEGIASLSPAIDYVFSGESEESFVRFLRAVAAGQVPSDREVRGSPVRRMDDLPTPRFDDYYEQMAAHLADSVHSRTMVLPYESSRGCWWGAVHHCTFCGISDEAMGFREKSPERVLEELDELLRHHPEPNVFMVDNIMPRRYFQTLIPRLATTFPGLRLFYEQKANLRLEHVVALERAGVHEIQPGIESFSSRLLRRMDKGVTGRQNVALLRYARAVDISVLWNLLWGIPGETADEHAEVASLLPLLRHLPPPNGLVHVSIDRFSPYFKQPGKYGIRRLEPLPSYSWTLPAHADARQVAFHFWGDYDSELYAQPALLRTLYDEVARWIEAWRGAARRPALTIQPVFGDWFLLTDTRGLPGFAETEVIERSKAVAALVTQPLDCAIEAEWAMARKVAVPLDGHLVALAVAPAALLQQFEAQSRRAHSRPEQESLPVVSAGASLRHT